MISVLAVILGVVVLAGTAADALDTLISTRIRPAGWWPTEVFYRLTWLPIRRIGGLIAPGSRRETFLSLYGPLSLVGLLAMWATGQIFGWSRVWWGLRGGLSVPLHSLLDSIYYSGVVYFSVGFGDVLPTSVPVRMLTIAEAFGGLGTMGLVIGYLPSLYGAYQARERQLLLLDDLTDARITPMTLLKSMVGPDGDVSRLEDFFDEWARWAAELFESHSSFPMLMLFRSKYPGQSWVTGLGVVTDTALSAIAAFPDGNNDAAMRLYRQSVRAYVRLAERVELEPAPFDPLPAHLYSVGYTAMQEMGLTLVPFDVGLRRVNELRRTFHPFMDAFIEFLHAPRGFWGVSSAEHMAEVSLSDLFDD